MSIFSAVYLPKYLGHYSLRYFSILYHALFASIVLVLIAGDAISFLSAWEAMSIASYLLVNYEHERDDSSHAGFVMLAMSEVGTIAVAIALILLGRAAGTFDFAGIGVGAAHGGEGVGWAVFLLSFFGFAVKAGLVPVNSWLPLAHPSRRPTCRRCCRRLIVNLGIYGIMRVNLDLLPVTGTLPGLIVLVDRQPVRPDRHPLRDDPGRDEAPPGAQHDREHGHRRGRPRRGDDVSRDRPLDRRGIALIAALYHLANHSVYKALLFIGTGAVEAGAGTRDLDRLGGIVRRMPWTSALFLVGVLSISALPPLNGFVSEWLTLADHTALGAPVLDRDQDRVRDLRRACWP